MKKRSEKKSAWQQYIPMVFCLLVGVVCGFLMVKFSADFSSGDSVHIEWISLVGLFLCLYVALIFHVIVHEAGHLVFGLLSGYKFGSFRIFSFMWLKENGKIRLKRLRVAGTAGQCLMIPPDWKGEKTPLILGNLGGVLLNTIVGAIFLGLFFLLSSVKVLSAVFLLFAIIGFTLAMMNGVPMRMGAVDNDGYNAISLSKNAEARKAFWVQLKIAEQTAKGIRLKDMPAEWFAVPSDEAMKNSMVAARGVFACNRLMDEEHFEEADALMAHMLKLDSGIIGVHRNLLVCDRMYVELIRENRHEVIERMLSKEQKNFMKSMKQFPSVLRTEYALALLFEKDLARAETVQKKFEKAAKSYPYAHEIESERDLMKIANDKARKEEQK